MFLIKATLSSLDSCNGIIPIARVDIFKEDINEEV